MNNLRSVKITYSDGNIIYTNMATNLTNKEIYNYFKIGKSFNIGCITDNMQTITKCEILK